MTASPEIIEFEVNRPQKPMTLAEAGLVQPETETPRQYVRTPSSKTPEEIAELKKQSQAKRTRRLALQDLADQWVQSKLAEPQSEILSKESKPSFWSRQSLSRLLGIVLGNTRELEKLLDAEREFHRKEIELLTKTHEGRIADLQAQVVAAESRCKDILDRYLLKTGMVPTGQALPNVGAKPEGQQSSQQRVSPHVKQAVDELMRLMATNPAEAEQKFEDWKYLASGVSYRKAEALAVIQYFLRTMEQNIPDETPGVVAEG